MLIHFLIGSNTIPWDGNVQIGGYEKINSLDTIEGRLLLSMTISGEIFVLFIFTFMFFYRSKPILRGSSTFFMSIMLFGVAVGFGSHTLFVGKLLSSWKCHFQIWFQVIPIPLIVFPLFLKELRCYILLSRRSLLSKADKYMSDAVLAIPLMLYLIGEVVDILPFFSFCLS